MIILERFPVTKAETVFEKLAISSRAVYSAEEGSKKLVDRITGSRKKYNSFEEKHQMFKTLMRKLRQKDFFEEAAKNLLRKQENSGIIKNFLKVRIP